jgi:uncharacterized membrane protein YeaQ/YmgE (transglycosylase-associated protein family)
LELESLTRRNQVNVFGDFIDLLRRAKMNFLIWIVVGGLLGWVASMIMKTDAQQGMFLNIVVGIVGALLGGWLLAPLFGTGTINQNDFSISSLLVSLLGAVILLAIVNLFRRGTPR